ncbi:uncharacterized protein LOC130897591 [Diorhabda carinulata]|uniref:uncharacterized protein LOC130897591 n=1 Tax=Diorhabda carinulata TaxID=1163345 RepID=UPI0025A1C97C|nr:uncharacterized protein LOC130897591 [Diorhabda carinulata]
MKTEVMVFCALRKVALFLNRSIARVVSETICDIYLSALDVSGYGSGNFDLSDSYRLRGLTTLNNDIIETEVILLFLTISAHAEETKKIEKPEESEEKAPEAIHTPYSFPLSSLGVPIGYYPSLALGNSLLGSSAAWQSPLGYGSPLIRSPYISTPYGLRNSHLVSPYTVPFAGLGRSIYTAETRNVPVPITQPIPVPINRPVPVAVPQAVPVHVVRSYPIHVTQPYPIPVERQVPIPVERAVPVPVKIPVRIVIPVPYKVGVPQPYPVPVPRAVAVPVPSPALFTPQARLPHRALYRGHVPVPQSIFSLPQSIFLRGQLPFQLPILKK